MTEGSLDAALATPQGEPLRKLAEHLNEAREHFAEVRVLLRSPSIPSTASAQAKLGGPGGL